MTDWKPIETAPKKTQVLATWADTWNQTGPHIEVCETGDDGIWFYSYDGDSPQSPPTHWMQRPERPLPNGEWRQRNEGA